MPRIKITKDDKPYKLYDKRPDKPASGSLPDPESELINMHKPGAWTRDVALRRYPRIVAHMMAESLGYFTAPSAAMALANALNGQDNWCEYIFSCFGKNPVKMVLAAIAHRKNHEGYMAAYEKGITQVAYELEGKGDPQALAGWN